MYAPVNGERVSVGSATQKFQAFVSVDVPSKGNVAERRLGKDGRLRRFEYEEEAEVQ
jgi:hypothetical protein